MSLSRPNALWLERITAYKNSLYAQISAETLIFLKIEQQSALLRKYHCSTFQNIITTKSLNELLLQEARAAKHFWAHYRDLIPTWTKFSGRQARGKDVVNQLLDIGYHHLGNEVGKIIEKHNVTLAPALLHVAQKENSTPLVYDLMELFRSDVIDAELLRFLRLKKKPITSLTQKDIAHFIYAINRRFEKRFFLKDFEQCHTYRYYMELQIIKFIKAVNHKEVFIPLHLPKRHDTRCSCKEKKM